MNENRIRVGPRCAICRKTAEHPFSNRCEHSFCRRCINKWLDQGASRCPSCRKAISMAEFLGDERASAILVPNPFLAGQDQPVRVSSIQVTKFALANFEKEEGEDQQVSLAVTDFYEQLVLELNELDDDGTAGSGEVPQMTGSTSNASFYDQQVDDVQFQHDDYDFEKVEVLVDCDPFQFVFPRVFKLLLEGDWTNDVLKSMIQFCFPWARDLTIMENHVEIMIASSPPQGLKSVALIHKDRQICDKLHRWTKKNKLVMRSFDAKSRLAWISIPAFEFGTSAGFLLVQRNHPIEDRIKKPKDLFRLLDAPRQCHYFLPLEAPRAAYLMFSYFFVLDVEVLDECGPIKGAHFITSRGKTSMIGFDGLLAQKRIEALDAFDALIHLHCRNMTDEFAILAILDGDAYPSGDIQIVKLEDVLPRLKSTCYAPRDAARKWILPGRTASFNIEISPIELLHGIEWIRKLEI